MMSYSPIVKEIIENIRNAEKELQKKETEVKHSKDDLLDEMVQVVEKLKQELKEVCEMNEKLRTENEMLKNRVCTLESIIVPPKEQNFTPSPNVHRTFDSESETPNTIVLNDELKFSKNDPQEKNFTPSPNLHRTFDSQAETPDTIVLNDYEREFLKKNGFPMKHCSAKKSLFR